MYAIRKPDRRRAVSPVIATVILVAITITVAVAVAYWMSSIAGQYTKFEKVEIQSGYSDKIVSGALGSEIYGWQITLELKNTGSATSTLLRVFVNDIAIPKDKYDLTTFTLGNGDIATSILYVGTTVESGATETVYIWIDDAWASVTSGTTVNVKVHSAAGMDYIKLVPLV